VGRREGERSEKREWGKRKWGGTEWGWEWNERGNVDAYDIIVS